MTRKLSVELVLDSRCEAQDGPLWDHRTNALWWLDMFAGEVHQFDPGTGRDRLIVNAGQKVGAIAPRATGGAVLAMRDGYGTLDEHGRIELIAQVEIEQMELRLNDGKCDRAGRFWASSIHQDPDLVHELMESGTTRRTGPGPAACYRLDPDGQVHQIFDGVTVGNGLAWSSDDSRMYYIDTVTRGVDVFDYDLDAGQVRNRRRFLELSLSDGLPDGMTIDADDCIWVALVRSGQVHRYTPTGQLDTVVHLPISHATSAAFGGSNLDELYITSATLHLTPQQLREQPHAGGIFMVQPGVAGLATNPYRG